MKPKTNSEELNKIIELFNEGKKPLIETEKFRANVTNVYWDYSACNAHAFEITLEIDEELKKDCDEFILKHFFKQEGDVYIANIYHNKDSAFDVKLVKEKPFQCKRLNDIFELIDEGQKPIVEIVTKTSIDDTAPIQGFIAYATQFYFDQENSCYQIDLEIDQKLKQFCQPIAKRTNQRHTGDEPIFDWFEANPSNRDGVYRFHVCECEGKPIIQLVNNARFKLFKQYLNSYVVEKISYFKWLENQLLR